MDRYEIQRDGKKPLQFSGELLAEVSTQHLKPRWTELRLYRTTRSTLDGYPVEVVGCYTPEAGSWVAEQVGRSKVHGETDRRRAWVCQSPDQVRRVLGGGPLAEELYIAADLDDAEVA